ncbi:MAG: hypothetical protein GX237_05215 [Clostridiales bacterium]|nr:hypothetical protein [Clostridiales bacterium]
MKKKISILKSVLLLACIISLFSLPMMVYGASSTQKSLPKINEFNVSEKNVSIGDTVILTWDVEDATSIKILGLEKEEEDKLPLSGSLEAWPMATTTYVLIATGEGGTSSSSVTVNVDKVGDVSIDSFNVSAEKVLLGDTVNLSWKTSNASMVTILGLEKEEEDQLPLCGSIEAWPMATTTYIIQATGYNGEVVSKAITVNIVDCLPAVINSFTVSSEEIYEGNTVTLEWDVTDAVSVKINDTEVDSSGAMDVTPVETTTYVLSATAADGQVVSESITVTVISGPRIISFDASATTVSKGKLVTLTWTTENATECVILTDDGIKLPNRPINGQISVTPNKTRTYTLVAYNDNQITDQKSITITVK